jgi:hypothetical protein
MLENWYLTVDIGLSFARRPVEEHKLDGGHVPLARDGEHA